MTHYQELPQALMKEKHQGQTLTKEEVKVQTAHDLGVENVSKEEGKSMYKTIKTTLLAHIEDMDTVWLKVETLKK